MSGFLVLVLAAMVVGMAWHGWRKSGGVFQYPFLAAIVFGAFVLTQLIGLVNDDSLPPWSVRKVTVMAILSLLAIWAGDQHGGRMGVNPSQECDMARMLRGAAVLTLLGSVLHVVLRVMSLQNTDMFLGTGLPVALLFLGGMLYCGLAISAIIAFRFASKTAIVLTVLGTLVLLERAVFLGRRSTALSIVVMLFMPRWFERGRGVSRWFMGLAIALGLLVHFSIGEYRALMSGEARKISTFSDIPFLANVESVLAEGGHEIRNAAFYVDAIDRTRSFDYGLYHWNVLVLNFVPAQIIGDQLKQSLILPIAPHSKMAEDIWGYVANTGSTLTGLVDAFGSFWYFGCLKFYLIALIMRRLYDRSVQRDFKAEIWFALLVVPALLCITHYTQWLPSSAIMYAIYLMPVFRYARRGDAHRGGIASRIG